MISFLPPDVSAVIELPGASTMPETWPPDLQAVIEAALTGVTGMALENVAKKAVRAQRHIMGRWDFFNVHKAPDYDTVYTHFGGDRRVSTAATVFLNALLTAVVDAAEELRPKLSVPSESVLAVSQRAQELDSFAGTWYMALSSWATSREGRLWSTTQEIAAAGRKSALQWYSYESSGASGSDNFEVVDAAVKAGKVARAVLGQDAYPMIEALSKGRAVVGPRTAASTYRGGYLRSEPPGSVFGPPIFGTYPTLHLVASEKTGAAEAWAMGTAYVFLRHATAVNVLRAPAPRGDVAEDERAMAEWQSSMEPGARIFSSMFAFENEVRLGGMMVRVYTGGDRSSYFPAVPLGRFPLWRMRADELGYRDLGRVAEDLRRAPWHYQAGRDLKKSETARGVSLDARGNVKWIKPDPFAR